MTSQARLVGGRYEEGEPLGRGGMADVRKGVDNRLGRTVAIKRLRVDLASDSTFQARFRREAQSAASLNHPTIVSVYDTGEEPDPNGSGITIPYIVMEYVAGKTLRDLIREGRKIMPERALEITSGVLEALDYSHRAGIVHRDIKPGNVMLTPQGQVKVMDFGIARAVADTSSTMTQTAAVIGTAQYLSPEQARGETVDARSDLYSTGCLLYELLVGRPPFVGESPVSVAYQHVREEPAPPSAFDPDIPPEVDAVVLKALTKNREHRYQSANEMRQDIHRVLAGQQVTAPMAAVAETRAIPATAVAPAMAGGPQYGQTQPNDLLPPDDGDDEAQAARARRNRGLAYFLLGLAIVALAVGAYAIITNLGGDDTANTPTQVAVPAVSGKTLDVATGQLTALGLKVASTQAASATVEKGLVVSSNPTANTMVDKDSTVNLVVSAGQNTFPVPDVIGKTESEARSLLGAPPGNFEVASNAKEQDSEEPAGTVLSVSPDPGKSYGPGTEFTLTISTGIVKVTVPDLIKQNQDDATAALKALGLAVGYEQAASGAVPGTVVKQSVAPNSKVDRGTKVIITIAIQPEETPSPSDTPSPTDTPSSPTITLPGGGGGPGEGNGGPGEGNGE